MTTSDISYLSMLQDKAKPNYTFAENINLTMKQFYAFLCACLFVSFGYGQASGTLGPDTTVCGSYTLAPNLPLNGSFIWITGELTPTITVDTIGTTEISLIYLDSLGFSSFDTVELTINPLPLLDLGTDTAVCIGDSIELLVSAEANVSYLWSTGNTTNSIQVNTGGSYSLMASNSITGCVSYDTIEVELITPLSTFPYLEDFEAEPNCTASAGATCTLVGDFVNADDDEIDWTVNNGGTSTPSTGPSVDYSLGTAAGKYLYTESSTFTVGFPDKSAILESPYFDFSAISNPQMSFAYHMLGADMGTLHVDIDTAAGDGGWILDVVPARTDDADVWQLWEVDLSGYSGKCVRFRIRGVTENGILSDMAIDHVRVYDVPPVDVGVTDVYVDGCGLPANAPIQIDVANIGSANLNAGDTIPVTFDAGTGMQSENLILTAAFNSGDTITYTFSTTLDLSTTGDYAIMAWTDLSDDSVFMANDTASLALVARPSVSSFPYLEDFEAGKGGWRSMGINGSWAFGSPNKLNIVGAASGDSAWTTGGLGLTFYNTNEISYVEGPCFDFTNAPTQPWVAFNAYWETEASRDGAALQYSTDNGQSWITVGNEGDGNNWYTSSAISADPGGQSQGWDGSSAGWVQAKHALNPALVGESQVLFRFAFASDIVIELDGFAFDDFAIASLPTVDLGNDTSICNGDELNPNLGAGTYLWSTGETTSSISLSNLSSSPRTDTISLTYTSPYGLCASDTIILTVLPSPSSNLPSDTLIACSLTLDAGAGFSSYFWSEGSATQSITVDSAGMYDVTVTDGNGCEGSDTVLVENYPAPEAAGAYVATSECVDSQAWTHYFDDVNGVKVLSLKKNGNNIGSIGDPKFEVVVEVFGPLNANIPGYGNGAMNLSSAPYVTNPNGFYAMNRYWNVEPVSPPSSEVEVKFYYTDTDLTDVQTAVPSILGHNDLHFYKIVSPDTADPSINLHANVNPANYIQLDYDTTVSTTTWVRETEGEFHVAHFAVNSFSGGGGGGAEGSIGAFPIELLAFDAMAENGQVLLDWVTATEQNSNVFVIERSIDGLIFEQLGSVDAAGNSSEARAYQYADDRPFVGLSYYRLKMLDADGAFTHSAIIEVLLTDELSFSLYPNPLKDVLQIRLNGVAQNEIEFELYDSKGRLMMQQVWDAVAGETHQVDLSQLINGMYFYRIREGRNMKTGELLKVE